MTEFNRLTTPTVLGTMEQITADIAAVPEGVAVGVTKDEAHASIGVTKGDVTVGARVSRTRRAWEYMVGLVWRPR